jgi:hypothetical protein
MSRVHLFVLAGALAFAGTAFAAYKVWWLGFPLWPEAQAEIWRVEVKLQFEADGGPARVVLKTPFATDRATVIDQGFSAPGYGLSTEESEASQRAVFAIREARGTQVLYYRVVFDSARHAAAAPPPPAPRAPSLRAQEIPAAKKIVDAARAQSDDPRTLAASILKQLRDARPADEARFLLGANPSAGRIASVATDLLRLAGTPARLVNGLQLEPERSGAQFVRWLEAWDGTQWFTLHPVEPGRAARRTLLPWWRGPTPLAEVKGGHGLVQVVTITRSYELALRAAVAQQRALERKLVEFSLFGLPLQSQSLFRTLLIVPLGVFVLVVLRNVVGFKSFGTFMPVLIALAFRQTGLAAGLVFFCIVLALGLAVRLYFERLKLLLVPRLAAVLIVVVIAIAVLSVFSSRIGLDVGLSIGLFPIVILTMTIERMTVTWEERGPAEALQQALGSLAVALVCYLLMQLSITEHLFFVFPELLLPLLAATLLLGRYTGFRLVELRRFRELRR